MKGLALTSQETGATRDFGSFLQARKLQIGRFRLAQKRCEAELTLPLIEVNAKKQEDPVLLYDS